MDVSVRLAERPFPSVEQSSVKLFGVRESVAVLVEERKGPDAAEGGGAVRAVDVTHRVDVDLEKVFGGDVEEGDARVVEDGGLQDVDREF